MPPRAPLSLEAQATRILDLFAHATEIGVGTVILSAYQAHADRWLYHRYLLGKVVVDDTLWNYLSAELVGFGSIHYPYRQRIWDLVRTYYALTGQLSGPFK